jgi:hypothetical protein
MRLLALRCGDLRTDAGVLFEGRPSGTKADVPIMTHAVDTGDGVLLWDTGINERCLSDLGAYLGPMMAQAFEAVGTPDTLTPARVEQAGFTVDDIRWVVNSHLHFDHCGCNRSYPVASWVVRARELAFYRSKLANPLFGLGTEDLGPEQPPELDYDGEHDLTGDGSLVLLDTDHIAPIGGEQTSWLAKTLADRQDRPHLIAVNHVPAYPSYRPSDGSGEKFGTGEEQRKYWSPLYEKFNVDVVLEHHDHTFKRTHPLTDGRYDKNGVIYLGDGSWGKLRVPKTPEERPYLAAVSEAYHMTVHRLEGQQRFHVALSESGKIEDVCMTANKRPARRG